MNASDFYYLSYVKTRKLIECVSSIRSNALFHSTKAGAQDFVIAEKSSESVKSKKNK